MDPSRECAGLSERFDDAWNKRVQAAAEWNSKLAGGKIHPSLYKKIMWAFEALKSDKDLVGDGKITSHQKKRTWKERRKALEDKWRDFDGKKEPSLAWALNDVFGFEFWTGGLFKVCVFLLNAPIDVFSSCIRSSETPHNLWVPYSFG